MCVFLFFFFIEEVCKVIVDLVFLIDFFGSISGCNWRLLKVFIKDVIDVFDVFFKGIYIVFVFYLLRLVVDYWFNILIGDKFNGLGFYKFVDKIRY